MNRHVRDITSEVIICKVQVWDVKVKILNKLSTEINRLGIKYLRPYSLASIPQVFGPVKCTQSKKIKTHLL
eukprot:snap_masked-scaffold_19-processed-gene-6.44-mRNA-1 protein AED:1.00 eAED:1.00 QI:0/0/0/0/1/1/2/0/70